jgi:hypothetical protein
MEWEKTCKVFLCGAIKVIIEFDDGKEQRPRPKQTIQLNGNKKFNMNKKHCSKEKSKIYNFYFFPGPSHSL